MRFRKGVPVLIDTSTLTTRRHQIFPVLDAQEMQRMRRFGVLRTFESGEALATAGQHSAGVMVILSGEVTASRKNVSGAGDDIVTYGPGGFLGGLEQLSGRPSLVDARAIGAVSALVIAPELLRTLFISEAALGERILRALILRRILLLEASAGGPIIVGYADDRNVLRLEGFLRRNGHPQQTLNAADDPDAKALIERLHIDATALPVVLCPNGELLRNPTEGELARCLGLVSPIDPARTYDVAVVGAGPAGLSAAVYAASDGLSVLVLDQHAFGGQAGASARIENYLGFPTGISGIALTGRAYNQAQKFGVEMAIPKTVMRVDTEVGPGSGEFSLRLAEDEFVRTRSIVVATGARYRRLAVDSLATFEGSSVHYWASPLEARLCAGQEVVIVGGGNSAGQATVYLATVASKVWLLLRSKDLSAKMSSYLVNRIGGLGNVEVVPEARISALEGENGFLEAVRWRQAGRSEVGRPIHHLFLFIGAEPNSSWLTGAEVALDSKGFVLTGGEMGRRTLETSRPGIFAVGDIRSGSTKRVATAVGDGAQVVANLHEYLATRDGGQVATAQRFTSTGSRAKDPRPNAVDRLKSRHNSSPPAVESQEPTMTPDKPGLDAAFVEQQRQSLLRLRARLIAAAQGIESDEADVNRQNNSGAVEFEDDAQRLDALERDGNLIVRDVARLACVDRALKKIDEGTYGLSDGNGKPITRERLEAAPEALYTLSEEEVREGHR
jgi:thioredoxin reductase (NADPH)